MVDPRSSLGHAVNVLSCIVGALLIVGLLVLGIGSVAHALSRTE